MVATSHARLWVIFMGAGLVGACGAPSSPSIGASVDAKEPASSCATRTGSRSARPLSREGGAVALARGERGLVAFVANTSARRVDVVDLVSRARRGSIAVSGTPEEVVLLDDGRLLVTLADRSAVESVAIGDDGLRAEGADACLVDLPRGPRGLAVTSDGATVVVTSSEKSALTILDGATLARVGGAELRRAPADVLVEGGRAWVSHLVGDGVSVVDLDGSSAPRMVDLRLRAATESAPSEALEKVRTASQGYAIASVVLPPAGGGEQRAIDGRAPRRRIVVPHVSVDVGDQFRFGVYYGPPPSHGIPKEAPVAVTIDPDTEKARTSRVLAMTPQGFARECLLPRAAAYRASTARLYVACRGIDELLELDADAADPMRVVLDRHELSKGVSGVAVADEEGLAVAFGEFDEALDVVSLSTGRRTKIDLGASTPTLSASYVRGRELFYASDDKRIAFDGIACASCHPDGGDDGLTWSTPEGPRQTPMLAGRVHDTGPYGWTRDAGTLPDYIQSTVTRLGGTGLAGDDLEALASFVERMPAPKTEVLPDVRRGRELFASNGCDECHHGVTGTDHQAHAVTTESRSYDTPTLRFVGLTAPYFHDGRYASLDELVADPKSRMGTSFRLDEGDRSALVKFLETL